MDIKERKAEINLVTLGTGVIFSALWSMFKSIIIYILMIAEKPEIFTLGDSVTTNIALVSAILIGFSLRFYIGVCARAEGNGKRVKRVYTVLTFIVLLYYGLAVPIEASIALFYSSGKLRNAVMLVIDLTFFILFIEVIVNSSAIRRMRKKRSAEEKAV